MSSLLPLLFGERVASNFPLSPFHPRHKTNIDRIDTNTAHKGRRKERKKERDQGKIDNNQRSKENFDENDNEKKQVRQKSKLRKRECSVTAYKMQVSFTLVTVSL